MGLPKAGEGFGHMQCRSISNYFILLLCYFILKIILLLHTAEQLHFPFPFSFVSYYAVIFLFVFVFYICSHKHFSSFLEV